MIKIGLDMYLYEQEYLSEYTNGERFKAVCEALGRDGSDDSISIDYTVGYWRKANHIHQWFVDNVQDGVDECQKSYVSSDNMKALYDTCKEVLDSIKTDDVDVPITLVEDGKFTETTEPGRSIINPSIAEKLLPTQSGFFFGGTEYDEWYIQDIEHTIEVLDRLKQDDGTFGRPGMYYYYRSSW